MRKVLIVEDNPDMREILALQMQQLEFTVVLAENGEEGVQKATAEKPDLVLMDILMPVMSGIEAARIIRSSFETREIPILAITAVFRESELKSCLEEGCSDYLVKPYTLQELKLKVEALVPSTVEGASETE